MKPWLHRLLAPFEVDLRSLAAFRIGLGALLLYDVLSRIPDLEAHYTDAGVLPRTAQPVWAHLGLYFWSGDIAAPATLLGLTALCAVALTLGFFTRVATVACWFLLISLHARNHLVLHGGDMLLRLLLFWSLFLPLGERWSLDARRDRGRGAADRRFRSAGGAGLLLQVCFMYWFGAALKAHPVWLSDLTAVYRALNIDIYTSALGRALSQHHGLLAVATAATMALEALGPLVVLATRRHHRVRLAVLACFFGLHLSFAIFMELGHFPYVCLVAWLPFLPAAVWDRCRRDPETGAARLAPAPGALNQAMAAALVVFVLAWNVRASWFKDVELGPVAEIFDEVGRGLVLDQRWDMYAPYPMTDDGWWVFEAETADGRRLDIWTGAEPVRWEKPANVAAATGNMRWRKYLRWVWRDQEGKDHRRFFADYIKRRWDRDHDVAERLRVLRLYYMLEVTPPPGEAPEPVQRHLVFEARDDTSD